MSGKGSYDDTTGAELFVEDRECDNEDDEGRELNDLRMNVQTDSVKVSQYEEKNVTIVTPPMIILRKLYIL